jgi:hypothetical protein
MNAAAPADPGLRIGGKFDDAGKLKGVKPCNRVYGCTALPNSGGAVQQLLRLAFKV